jgi:hypothetical protein
MAIAELRDFFHNAAGNSGNKLPCTICIATEQSRQGREAYNITAATIAFRIFLHSKR